MLIIPKGKRLSCISMNPLKSSLSSPKLNVPLDSPLNPTYHLSLDFSHSNSRYSSISSLSSLNGKDENDPLGVKETNETNEVSEEYKINSSAYTLYSSSYSNICVVRCKLFIYSKESTLDSLHSVPSTSVPSYTQFTSIITPNDIQTISSFSNEYIQITNENDIIHILNPSLKLVQGTIHITKKDSY